jgi:hypothetical protein
MRTSRAIGARASNHLAARGLGSRSETITTGSDTLNIGNFFAGAAEPHMNILIFHSEFGREISDGYALVAGRTKRRQNFRFQRATSAAVSSFRTPGSFGPSGRGRIASAASRSSASNGRFSPAAGVDAAHLGFQFFEIVQESVASPRQLDEAFKRGGIDF